MEREPTRVLVVDDEPDMCWVLEKILRPAGFAVTTTTKGAEALKLATEADYAVAFVDAKLTDLDGLELAAMIRQRSAHTAIVLISGYFYGEDPAIIEGLQKDLFTGFIAKPFDLKEVRLIASQAAGRSAKEEYADEPYSAGG